MNDEDYFAQIATDLAQDRMNKIHKWYDYKTDPLYYAADRIKQKRREKYLSRGPSLWRGPQRDSEPPPTNGESK